MKKLFACVLCFALLLSLTACPSSNGEPPETTSTEELAKKPSIHL